MGGYGSGKYYRQSTKSKTKDTLSIDIRELNKKKAIAPGNSIIITWNRNEGKSSSVAGKFFDDHILLKYSDAKDNNVNQKIYFEWAKCNYGGKRPWFLCPSCGKRRLLVYIKELYFACRECCNLTYQTQCDTKTDRMDKRARRLKKRVGIREDTMLGDFLIKPKFMHFRKFVKIRDEIESFGYKSMISCPFYKKYGVHI